ncbi:MAG: site-specific DNA-methyltransferase [Actinomycetota bacterium]|nr:site-specific DNA-methyltransferase [Actinomycetota bacterium]
MADELDVLLDKIDDPALRSEIKAQVGRVRAKRTFGLVFEDHLPERVRLPDHPVRRGVRVVRRDGSDDESMIVLAVSDEQVTVEHGDRSTDTIAVADLVVIAEFGDRIHPGLQRLGTIDRGGDKPAHVVINAENHHALELLQFTHAGKVDCIYIDPPYNTGARDWKYDNDYVDNDDAYRHSKWLAFMQRRLKLAKQLLNPEDSVLIVTIDEKEVHRLGLLLEQVFAGHDIQTVSAVINPAGSARVGRLTRVDEYLFYVFIGSGIAQVTPIATLGPKTTSGTMPTVWFSAMRNGVGNALRVNRSTPVLFYPVHVDATSGHFHSVGEPLPHGRDRAGHMAPEGTIAVWPLSSEGREQT